jgi:nicotinamide-nucleotide amidase
MTIPAEILTVGDEILQGRTVNGNAAFLGRALTEIGISVRWSSTVGDVTDDIVEAIHQAFTRVEVVVLTGGLGPTPDDLTRDAICKAFDLHLIEDPDQRKHVEKLFEKFGRNVPAASENQYLIPEHAIRIHNPRGTAAGIHYSRDGRHLFALPGVPQEMEEMALDYILPLLKDVYPSAGLSQKTLRLAGIGESALLEAMGDRTQIEQVIQFAFLPNHGLLDVRLTARSDDPHEAAFQIANAEAFIRECAGRNVYGTGRDRLEQIIGDILLNRCQKLATAESCTGGMIGSRLTDIPGASHWFERGFITYSDRAKSDLLKIPTELIETHGAVSEPVAIAMAVGAREQSGSHWGASVTGIAGPEGGTSEKPVGTVWIAVSSDNKTQAKLLHLGAGDRNRIRLRATHSLLFALYCALIEAVI